MTTVLQTSIAIIISLVLGSVAQAHGGHEEPAQAAHLVFKNETLHIHAKIPNKPVVGEESFIVLETKNPETHENIEIADTIEVALWMPSMGHGSAPTTVERALDENGEVIPGVYNVREVYFTMGGEWEVNVTLTDAEGNSETQTFAVKLKGGHGH